MNAAIRRESPWELEVEPSGGVPDTHQHICLCPPASSQPPTMVFSSPVLVIPPEIVEYTLTFCHPCDVASFSLTCRFAYELVYGATGSHLWRQLFLSYPFDDPRKSLKARDDPHYILKFNWRGELQRRVRSGAIKFSANSEIQPLRLKYLLETFVSVVQGASPVSNEFENTPSHDLEWVTQVLWNSQDLFYMNAFPGHPTEPQQLQQLAQLKSYSALSLTGSVITNSYLAQRRAVSRCYVYDLRNYRFENSWGPFMNSGRVNWRHVEAILTVILTNLAETSSRWRPPVGLQAARAYSAPGTLVCAQKDWAGVEGTWKRYICFMDYRDLFAFNFSDNGPCHPSFFEDQAFREATRLMELKLRLVPPEAMHTGSRVLPESYPINTCQYPPLYFTGTPRGVTPSHATVEGCVRMGEDGAVRWHFTSIYDGITQWCSEGVQIGNIASAIGVAGAWSGGLHTPGDPVGPFWLWRVQEDHSGEFGMFL